MDTTFRFPFPSLPFPFPSFQPSSVHPLEPRSSNTQLTQPSSASTLSLRPPSRRVHLHFGSNPRSRICDIGGTGCASGSIRTAAIIGFKRSNRISIPITALNSDYSQRHDVGNSLCSLTGRIHPISTLLKGQPTSTERASVIRISPYRASSQQTQRKTGCSGRFQKEPAILCVSVTARIDRLPPHHVISPSPRALRQSVR